MTYFEPALIAMILCSNVTFPDKCFERYEACEKSSAVCLDELEDRIKCEGALN